MIRNGHSSRPLIKHVGGAQTLLFGPRVTMILSLVYFYGPVQISL